MSAKMKFVQLCLFTMNSEKIRMFVSEAFDALMY